jgi:hypothetical protein
MTRVSSLSVPTRRHWSLAIAVGATLLCWTCGSVPASPSSPSSSVLNEATVIDALEYWKSAAGITYTIVGSDVVPRLLMRPGVDGLGSATARGLIDGTIAGTNEARSGLVVIQTNFGSTCTPSDFSCRAIFRHEVGHGIGYLGEPPGSSLMSAFPGTDLLSDRERNMVVTLYSLPIGARLNPDGSWSAATTGTSGKLDDLQAVQDVIEYNANSISGASFRTLGIICRWQLPVPVYFQR